MLRNREAPVDALRGLGCLGIFLFHASVIGFTKTKLLDIRCSILIFCVLSGYTLAKTFRPAGHFWTSYKAFLVRRIFRIVPTFFFLTLVSLHTFNILSGRAEFTWSPYLQNFAFIFAFFKRPTDPTGLNPRDNSIVPGQWFLFAEIVFYLLFPFLAWLWRSGSRKKLGLLVLFAAALFAGAALTAIHPSLTRTWEGWGPLLSPLIFLHTFLLGCLLQWLAKGPRSKSLDGLTLALGLVLAVFPVAQEIRGGIALVSAGLALFVRGFIGLFSEGESFALKPLAALGRISYPFYLAHIPVLLLYASYARAHLLAIYGRPLPLSGHLVLGFGACAGVSYLIHKAVEMPGVLQGKRLSARILGLGLRDGEWEKGKARWRPALNQE